MAKRKTITARRPDGTIISLRIEPDYTPIELQIKIDEWFDEYLLKHKEEMPDIEGLCKYLNIVRSTLSRYEKQSPYNYTVTRAKEHILFFKKQAGWNGKANPQILQFDLKNNHGYCDKTEVDSNVNTKTQVIIKLPSNGLERDGD